MNEYRNKINTGQHISYTLSFQNISHCLFISFSKKRKITEIQYKRSKIKIKFRQPYLLVDYKSTY